MAKTDNRYTQIIEHIFSGKYKSGDREVEFHRDDLVSAAAKLDIKLPKNLGDVVYSFRYRTDLPDSIRNQAPEGLEWVIRPIGQAKYKFSLANFPKITPNTLLAETKIPDATPGIIVKHAFSDEQGLLARLRHNRLIDIFSGVACYSLQSHLRTTVPGIGQVETDEIYVGIDKQGAQYVFPVQAKGRTDRIGIVQIEQDLALCADKFPHLICRPIAVQFMEDDLIALFAFEEADNGISMSEERHYRLVSPERMTDKDLAAYRKRTTSTA